NRVYAKCLDFTAVVPVQGPQTSVTTEFSAQLVNSREELYHHLNIDAQLSASSMFGSGQASFSFDDEYHFQSTDLVWVVKASSDYGRFVMDSPVLTYSARALMTDPAAFARQCGYEFVGQERRMVQAVAVYSLHDLSESEKSHVQAAL